MGGYSQSVLSMRILHLIGVQPPGLARCRHKAGRYGLTLTFHEYGKENTGGWVTWGGCKTPAGMSVRGPR